MKVVDTYELFKINPKHKASVTELGNGLKVVELEDFYLYPEKIEEYARGLTVCEKKQLEHSGFPDLRFEQNAFFPKKYFKEISNIIETHMPGVESCAVSGQHLAAPNDNVVFNYTPANTDPEDVNRVSYFPHIDPILITGVVPFTKTNKGTSFFRHRHTNCIYVIDDHPQSATSNSACKKYYYRVLKNIRDQHHHEMSEYVKLGMGSLQPDGQPIPNEPILDDSSPHFELLYTTSGKYNSACFFPGGMPHSSACERPAKEERIVQLLTLE